MDVLPAGGIALVVPGFFVCAGILLYSAIIATLMGLYRGREPIDLAFAGSCLTSAAMSFGLATYYSAESIEGAIRAMHAVNGASILFIVSLFAFIGLYTRARIPASRYLALGLAAAACIAADLALPYGIRFGAVTGFHHLQLPWGESVFRIEAQPGLANVAFRTAIVAVAAWSVWRLLDFARRGDRRDAIVLAAYLVLLFGSSVQGMLIDYGVLEQVHWTPVVLVGLALLMGVNLLIRMREHVLALATAIREDELTGLPNRRAVRERLRKHVEHSVPGLHGALLECDLDHFKVVNDGLGQEVGDALLREVAGRLRTCAHGQATVARVGGNAFVLVLEKAFATEREASTALDVLARMVAAALSAPFQVEERSIGLTVSLGVVTFETRKASATEVFARASLAVELAKRRGRNNIQSFVPQMQRDADRRFRIVEGLRGAVGRAELSLYYQPLVDAEGRTLGAECLLRWHSPELGEVGPGTFIPIAEETGLIHQLGEWTLRTACHRIMAWRRARVGFAGYLSVNVSAWQLAHPEFVARLREILAAHQVGPGELTLEVTESAVLFDTAEAVAKLTELRGLGVKVALDDFGTGYSSLALVKDLPLDLVKVDQSFVRHLGEGANRHLIRVIAAMGAELRLGVVAEGVETVEQREQLLALGCTGFQGYLFARPMPEPIFVAWLAAAAPARAALSELLSPGSSSPAH